MSSSKLASGSAALVAGGSRVTLLNALQVTPDIVVLGFNTLPGNMPNTYGNFAALWQGTGEIPWSAQPLAIQPIATNTPSGTIAFTGLDLHGNAYVLGYSVGPTKTGGEAQKYGNICSTVSIPPGGGPTQDFQTSLALLYVGPDQVLVRFSTPGGYRPAANRNWLGLWQGMEASYSQRPQYSTPITADSNFGTGTFSGAQILVGTTYTIGYFMSGWIGAGQANEQTALACSITFTT
ncbi:MAG TPA: hypothetical protein VI756_01165 [Blastocatellia bacterium]